MPCGRAAGSGELVTIDTAQRRKQRPPSVALSPVALAQEIQRLSAQLEDQTDAYALAAEEAAHAEVAYKRKHAEVVVRASDEAGNGTSGRTTVDEREARALIATADLYAQRLISAAIRDSALEAVRTTRSQLSALQSALRSVQDAERHA